jgi:hypothetical protein
MSGGGGITLLKSWQERLLDEKNDLDARISKLTSFALTEAFLTLSRADQELLTEQRQHMLGYSTVLGVRIARF